MLVPAARRDAIRRRLLAWYDAGHRELPWRAGQWEADPYRVWIAEAMLQQTQVAAAIPYYLRFVGRYPTLDALASADDDDVMALWSGLGYYRRCLSVLEAARETLRRHGALPASVEALRALPGFGPYTAGAVASIAFGVPAAAVDGNVARVLARVFLVEGETDDRAVRGRLWQLARALVPGSDQKRGDPSSARMRPRPGDFNQALMELGAILCRRRPHCPRCPLGTVCEAHRAGREREVPTARRRRVRPEVRLAAALVARRGRVLVARAPRGLFAGLWGLPAAPFGGGTTSAAALSAMLGPGLSVGDEVASVTRTLTHRELSLTAYRCRLDRGSRVPAGVELRWIPVRALAGLPMSVAMRRLVAAAVAVRPPAPAAPARARRRMAARPKRP